jgi:hypothetical protein
VGRQAGALGPAGLTLEPDGEVWVVRKGLDGAVGAGTDAFDLAVL